MSVLEDRPLADTALVVLDTETTGLDPALGHRLVELGALRLAPAAPGRWATVGEFSQLIDPGRSIEPGAQRVHGLREADLVDQPRFEAVAAALRTFAADALLVAHNARFDASFIGHEYGLLNQPGLTQPWLCTMLLARRHFYFGGNSLANVARRLGVPQGRAHRALNDAHTTALVLQRMVQSLAELRLVTVGDYLLAQGGPIYAESPLLSHNSLDGTPLDRELVAALTAGRPLRISYGSAAGVTERVVEPLQLNRRNGVLYLVAHCRLRNAQRTFRVDRITRYEIVRN